MSKKIAVKVIRVATMYVLAAVGMLVFIAAINMGSL